MNEKLFPIRKSHGYVVLPHKEGGEEQLIKKIVHLVSCCKIGAGFLYQSKVIIRENNHWEFHYIGETRALETSLYDMNNKHYVFELAS